MSVNGHPHNGTAKDAELRWAGRVVTAEDLQRSLNGHRELVLLPQAVVTPLATEELRTRGVKVTRQSESPRARTTSIWGYAQDRPHALVRSAVQSLEREGLALRQWPACPPGAECDWSRDLAGCVIRGECRGGVVFCGDPGLVCCVANKLPGLRAVSTTTVNQAARATLTLGANLLIVEMPGRTYFEVRQIFRILAAMIVPACPPGVACTLKELDGHAHR